MKTRYAEEVRHSGTIDSDESFLMSLDMTSLPHVQSILTNIYSDKELAVVREISTNALDSHRQAGITDPIAITLPNSFNPTFVVKDHGLGMSEEQVRDEFSKYGASSKRATDIAVGYLGIGCKSPLTYTSQFTMTCIKDGKKIVVLITKNEQNIGEINIVGRFDTDEPDGVEVQVPVVNFRTFNDKARNFFWFWRPGEVEINGEPLTDCWTETDGGLVLKDDVILHSGLDRDYIVMGNVPYSVDRKLTEYSYGSYCAAVRVDIGAVDFTPSRESLHYTKRTEKAVADAHDYIEENVILKAQQEVDAAATHAEAFDVAKRWRNGLLTGTTKFTYKGENIPVYVLPADGEEGILTWHDDGYYSGRYAAAKWENHIQVEQARRCIHVTGMKGKSLTQNIKRAITKWRNANNVLERAIIVSRLPVGRPWVGDVHEVSWDDLKKIAIEGPKHRPERYKVLRNNGSVAVTTTLRLGSKKHNRGRVVWVESGFNVERQHLFAIVGNGVTVVLVDKKSEKKWREQHPEILHVRQYAALRAARITNAMTSEDAWAMDHAYDWESSTFSSLDADRIEDPELAALIREAPTVNRRASIIDRYNVVTRLCNTVAIDGPTKPPSSEFADQLETARERYPLTEEVNTYSWRRDNKEQAVYDYINALYIARQHDYVDNHTKEKTAA